MSYITVETYIEVEVDPSEVIEKLDEDDLSEAINRLAPNLQRDVLELYHAISDENKSEINYRLDNIFRQLRMPLPLKSAA